MEVAIIWKGNTISFVVSEKAEEKERVEASFNSDEECYKVFDFFRKSMEKIGFSKIPAETLATFGAKDEDIRGEVVFFFQ